jgi:hypothetical protein
VCWTEAPKGREFDQLRETVLFTPYVMSLFPLNPKSRGHNHKTLIWNMELNYSCTCVLCQKLRKSAYDMVSNEIHKLIEQIPHMVWEGIEVEAVM